MEMKSYEPGTFCWVDLSTTDTEGAKSFYGQLLGWQLRESPIPDGGVYVMAEVNGGGVAGLFKQDDDETTKGVPSHWNSYVSVTDIDATASRVEGLGGKLLMAPFDVMDVGRMAVLFDPTGAAVCLWQPKQHAGAERVNEPGAVCWNELYTDNMDVAGKFYCDLLGWTASTDKAYGSNMMLFENKGRPAATMMQIQKEWGPVPPHWAVYFAVTDCDQAINKVKSLGGAVLAGPIDIPDIGRFATVKDPQGAVFSIIKLVDNS